MTRLTKQSNLVYRFNDSVSKYIAIKPIFVKDDDSLMALYEIIYKLGKLEDIEERLQKYKEFGINDLVSLFNKLDDEDIERFVLMTFKTERIISQKIFPNSKLLQYRQIEEELDIDLVTLFKALKNGIYYKYVELDGKTYGDEIYFEKPEHLSIGLKGLICAYRDYFGDDLRYAYEYKDCHITWALTKEELEK